MATFFEIFNKVLLELNYRTVSAFEEIYKSEHIKILDAINRVNEEVLSSDEWAFLMRTRIFKQKQCFTSTIPDEKSLYTDGIIKAVCKGTKQLSYFSDVQKAITEGFPADCYAVRETVNGSQILTGGENGALYVLEKTEISPQNKQSKPNEFAISVLKGDCTVFYYSKDYCIGANGEFKPKMTDGEDISLIPMPWAEHILLYGACLKVKANPAYPKFAFWNTMYIQALANLRKKSPSTIEDEAFISL